MGREFNTKITFGCLTWARFPCSTCLFLDVLNTQLGKFEYIYASRRDVSGLTTMSTRRTWWLLLGAVKDGGHAS